MLCRLSIRNIVLIEQLELSFENGLCCLTGETGSGKSILLDALGLVLGNRFEQRMLRSGADHASVCAEFDLSYATRCRALLDHLALPCDDRLVMRRVIDKEGRSRAFVNDVPVNISTLRQLGEMLVTIHGQHAQRGLLDPAEHVLLLDAFAGLESLRMEVAALWKKWQQAATELERLRADAAHREREQEFLTHNVQELEALAPMPGEETELATERQQMMAAESSLSRLQHGLQLFGDPEPVLSRLRAIEGKLAGADPVFEDRLAPIFTALGLAEDQISLAEDALTSLLEDQHYDPQALERTEERLFAIRGAARKHQCHPDELAELLETMKRDLTALEQHDEQIDGLQQQIVALRTAYMQHAEQLSAERTQHARQLQAAVMTQLAPLKMERARFEVVLIPLPDGSADGLERVQFLIATNPGASAGPLHKIASGGELSRLMLALIVALSEVETTPVMIFDEIDTGVGGAVAEAIGQRLAMIASQRTDHHLKQQRQIFVVTHQPQVAARAQHHYRIWKTHDEEHTTTHIQPLDSHSKREELARMLAGHRITDEARAAADALLEPA